MANDENPIDAAIFAYKLKFNSQRERERDFDFKEEKI